MNYAKQQFYLELIEYIYQKANENKEHMKINIYLKDVNIIKYMRMQISIKKNIMKVAEKEMNLKY